MDLILSNIKKKINKKNNEELKLDKDGKKITRIKSKKMIIMNVQMIMIQKKKIKY